MKFSYKLSDAIHILTFLSIYKDDNLSSKKIADSIISNASMVHGLMVDLRKTGLITTHQGSATSLLSKNYPHENAEMNAYSRIKQVTIANVI